MYINPSSKIFLIVFLQYRKDGTFLACLVAEKNGKGVTFCAYVNCATFYNMPASLCVVLCACYAMCNVPIPILCRLLYFASSVHIYIVPLSILCRQCVYLYCAAFYIVQTVCISIFCRLTTKSWMTFHPRSPPATYLLLSL